MRGDQVGGFCVEYPDGSGSDCVFAIDAGHLVLALMPAEAKMWRDGTFKEVPLLTLRHTCGSLVFIETLDDIPLASVPCPVGDGFLVRYTREFPYATEMS